MKHSDPYFLRRAFTLVELLVVVAIIGVLAALVLSGTRYASKVTKLNRIRTELRELETAIENYKSKMGFYPPDSANPAVPPLYYELVGVYQDPSNPSVFRSADDRETIDSATVVANFNVPAFANTAASRDQVKSFLPELSTKKMLMISASPDVDILRPSVGVGPNDSSPRWNYTSRAPVRNPKTYDLWTEVVFSGETNRIGNWKTGR